MAVSWDVVLSDIKAALSVAFYYIRVERKLMPGDPDGAIWVTSDADAILDRATNHQWNPLLTSQIIGVSLPGLGGTSNQQWQEFKKRFFAELDRVWPIYLAGDAGVPAPEPWDETEYGYVDITTGEITDPAKVHDPSKAAAVDMFNFLKNLPMVMVIIAILIILGIVAYYFLIHKPNAEMMQGLMAEAIQ